MTVWLMKGMIYKRYKGEDTVGRPVSQTKHTEIVIVNSIQSQPGNFDSVLYFRIVTSMSLGL